MKAADAKRTALLVACLGELNDLRATIAGARDADSPCLELQVSSYDEGLGMEDYLAPSVCLPLDYGEFMIPYCEKLIREELARLGVEINEQET